MYKIQDVTDVQKVFGGSVKKLMPKYEDIPKEFKRGSTKWNQMVHDWFFKGIKNLRLVPKDGVDTEKAMRHISTILASFEPKHEHKEAACAFLMNEWFEDVQYEINSDK